MQELFKRSVSAAFIVAYLMDALIAVAAAHKSTLPEEDRNFYQTEATRLLTRSLTKFNARTRSPKTTPWPLFCTLCCLDN